MASFLVRTITCMLLLLLCAAVAGAPCGPDFGNVLLTHNQASLVSLSIKLVDSLVLAGNTSRLAAIAKYSDGSIRELSDKVWWESSDPGVATVTDFGLATALSAGSTTITARLGSFASSAALTVQPRLAPLPQPLLLVINRENPFTAYLAEILRAEGLNEFDVLDISRVNSNVLRTYNLVLLGDMPLSTSQVAMISEWVERGGQLITMRPDKQLASLLGLADTGDNLSDTYLQINTQSAPGMGLVAYPIQYHGSADRYLLKGAISLATLYYNPTTPTSNPAVTLNAVGRGQAVAFTYDLAKSVVYTRQGNPAWSGQARGDKVPIRAYDLFYGNSRNDPRPDWVDFNNIAIPQADEQQRLLANLIVKMSAQRSPLPRFWYLPRELKAVVVMTGDDHGSFYGDGGTTAKRFSDYLAASPRGCRVENWECVRASAYLFPPSVAASSLTPQQSADFVSQGFEISVHPNENCSNWSAASLSALYTAQLKSFSARYTTVPAPQTSRTHCVSWSDYDSQPLVELKHGIRIDANYYYYPYTWVNNRPGLFTGSGLPMRFATHNGVPIDVYQLPTQMTDESGQSYPFHIDTLLDNALGPQGYYGVFTANMHADTTETSAALSIVASAQKRGVPVISALQMLKWLDGRNGSFFSTFHWGRGTLAFQVSVAPGSDGLSVLLPVEGLSGRLTTVRLNRKPIPFNTRVIKGIKYASFAARAGGMVQARYSMPSSNLDR
ncbi:MAG TPA: Ig-like domain-containing protein [Terriglobales bacterium]|nr:Ig-like domain-containing protein [Terriglobales bacterium]